MNKSKLFVVVALSVTICASLISADDHRHHNHQQDAECTEDSQCGTNVQCQQGHCNCPYKSHVSVPGASPVCQPLVLFGKPCKYDQQCEGQDQMCGMKSKKCECQPNAKPFEDTCYVNTTINGHCLTDQQCKAFIEPEQHVRCSRQSAGQQSCKCDDGVKCTMKKNGSTNFGLATSLLTLTTMTVMAIHVLL